MLITLILILVALIILILIVANGLDIIVTHQEEIIKLLKEIKNKD